MRELSNSKDGALDSVTLLKALESASLLKSVLFNSCDALWTLGDGCCCCNDDGVVDRDVLLLLYAENRWKLLFGVDVNTINNENCWGKGGRVSCCAECGGWGGEGAEKL